ncbi:hypothetical protein FA95DRAFT_1478470, partial [Auriscalpium vulgare]
LIRQSPDVAGFEIPGVNRPVKVRLFADDTVLYLKATDRYDVVLQITRKWCAVSGAKFNEEKTEIIPIGSQAHRKKVIETRRLNDQDSILAASIKIAQDGHPVRSLGSWIGNKVDDAEPWAPIIDKISAELDRWGKGKPTLLAKKLIIQMVVGGRTQYLTKVQGMPQHIENILIKKIREFIWEGKAVPPLAIEYLYLPKDEGGIGLLDLKARNEAIHIT